MLNSTFLLKLRPSVQILLCYYFNRLWAPDMTLNTLNISSNSDLATLMVPKLCDNGSNWSDYQPRLQNVIQAKGLWRHVEGTTTASIPFVMSDSITMLADGKTLASEDQIETKESKIIEFKKRVPSSAYIDVDDLDSSCNKD